MISYDIFAINVVTVMLGYVYGNGMLLVTIGPEHSVHVTLGSTDQSASIAGVAGRSLSPMQQLGVKVATPGGIIVGQLLFGWLGDVMGRKRICESTWMLYTMTQTHHTWSVSTNRWV